MNGGDEEDFIFSFEYDPLLVFKRINNLEFNICELSEWCESMEKRLKNIEGNLNER